MKTLLIFPPMVDAMHPPLGVASISGYLKEIGQKSVEQLDLNLLSHYYFLNSSYLSRIYPEVKKRYNRLIGKDDLNKDQKKEYQILSRAISNADNLIKNIDTKLQLLKEQDIYGKLDEYYDLTNFLKEAMNYISAAFHPSTWSIDQQFIFKYSPFKTKDILQALKDEKENPFIKFYNDTFPDITKSNPKIIGVSICYFEQVIPALTLIKILKQNLKDITIVAGGTFFYLYRNNWDVFTPFSELIDAIIPDEGEKPFLNIINAFESGGSLSDVSGIVYFENNKAIHNEIEKPEEAFAVCLPDFEGFPLDLYLSPHKILPYKTNMGCYWGKCVYCSSTMISSYGYKEKKASRIIDDMKKLSELYGVNNFYFVDEALSPSVARKLALEISRQHLSFNWFGDTRLEATLTEEFLTDLHEGGCLMLSFGFESIVKRVLNHMKKNTNPDIISQILRNCKKAGIKTFLMFFLGFPSETREEGMETISFIEKHKDEIHYIAYDKFTLVKNTYIYKNLDEYDLDIIHDKDEDEDLAVWFNYKCSSSGLYGQELIDFIEETRKRPIIDSLRKNVVSRSHLPYLSTV